MLNVLVTGANGQLGSEIRACKRNESAYYLFTDVAELDIADLVALRAYVAHHAIDVIVNCAAYTAVDKAEDDQDLADKINHIAARNLAVISKEQECTLIHVSTDYVFDGSKNTPYVETDPTTPLGVYGSTKRAGEIAIEESGCNYLIFRTSWLYSSFGNNFVKTIRRFGQERDTLNVVFDQVGTPTYAADLAACIVGIIENDTYRQHQGIYHYSNEGVISWYDFAKAIVSLSEITCDVQPCHSDQFPAKVKRPNYSVLDKTKLKQDFNCTVPYWKDSLQKCIELLK